MKTVLAATLMLGLTGASAFAACGHDVVQTQTDQTVASVDTSTTASTTPQKAATNEAKRADAD